VAVVHDYDMMRLSVAFYLISTATVLSPPTSTCLISESSTQLR
jgi:hypothetical protein